MVSSPLDGVHLTLPPHIFSVQVKLRSMLNHGSVGSSSRYNKRNLTPTLSIILNFLLPSIVFHNKTCVFIMIFMALSFIWIIHGLFIIRVRNVSYTICSPMDSARVIIWTLIGSLQLPVLPNCIGNSVSRRGDHHPKQFSRIV